jgi:hypothetical protein
MDRLSLPVFDQVEGELRAKLEGGWTGLARARNYFACKVSI